MYQNRSYLFRPVNFPNEAMKLRARVILIFLVIFIGLALFLAGKANLTAFLPAAPSSSPLTTVSNPIPVSTEPLSAASPFDFHDKVLMVSTTNLEIRVEAGAISFARNKITGETWVNSSAYSSNRPLSDSSFLGYSSRSLFGLTKTNWPDQGSQVSFSTTSQNSGRLTYQSLSANFIPNKNQFILDISVDAASGEIIFQLTGIDSNPQATLNSVNIPVLGATTSAVLLGNGEKVFRADENEVSQTTNIRYGLFSPSMAILQGKSSVLAMWSEPKEYVPEFIILKHFQAYDQVILHSESRPGEISTGKISSPAWRIGAYPSWTKAAQRWRERFEERTGAKPLWENSTPWVRKIHAVFDSTLQDYGNDAQKYAELASIVPPENMAYLLWNGDRIVLLGDNTLADQVALPTPAILDAVKEYGWKLILYHPFDLIYSKVGADNRLAFLQRQGWLPENYQFKPDYPGDPQNWFNYWSTIQTNYEDGKKLLALHPGASRFRRYLAQNISDYVSLYSANGLYFDTLGVDEDHLFPQDKKIIEEANFVDGAIDALVAVKSRLPDLGFMSEYQSPWVLPYIFYSWAGSGTWDSQAAYVRIRINHPLRVALTGSYAWSRSSTEEFPDDITSAFMGDLPQVSLVGDAKIREDTARWTQARASLFCKEELFNDLPDQWDEGSLAYYRSMRTGHWFKLVKDSTGIQYIEIMDDGTPKVRLSRTLP